ncbi:MAG TPA: hypothetical protein G4O13_02370 [Dehalococcoidia bacterium]|nr:hypothetical protein [Dehalococcoidia bacterium]
MWDEFGVILGSYILGSIPFIYIMGRLQGIDLREYEDMHIALWQKFGRTQAFIGTFSDFFKGIIAVLVAREAFDLSPGWVAFAGVAAVAGQMWPVFMKFDGEKGNSIGLAMSGTLATKTMLFGLIPIVIGFGVRTLPRFFARHQTIDDRLKFGGPPSLSLPLGMLGGFTVMPLAAWGLGQPSEVVIAFVGLVVLIIVRRLTAGLREDLRKPLDKRSVLLNRFLFDRSEV